MNCQTRIKKKREKKIVNLRNVSVTEYFIVKHNKTIETSHFCSLQIFNRLMRNRLKQQIYRSQNVTNNINSSQENGDKTNAGAKRVVKPKKKLKKTPENQNSK